MTTINPPQPGGEQLMHDDFASVGTEAPAAWYNTAKGRLGLAVGAAGLAVVSLFGFRGDGEAVGITPTTLALPDNPGTGVAPANVTPTSLTRSEQLKRYSEAEAGYLHYEVFQVAPVQDQDPAAYVQGLNRLFAVAVMDSDNAKSQQAVQTLTGTTATPARFRQFIQTTRARNLNELSPQTGGRTTFFSDPNDTTVVRSGANYAIIKTTNVLLSVSDRKIQPPTEVNSTKSTAYYYVRVLPDGTKQLLAVDTGLTDWQGGDILQ